MSGCVDTKLVFFIVFGALLAGMLVGILSGYSLGINSGGVSIEYSAPQINISSDCPQVDCYEVITEQSRDLSRLKRALNQT